MADLIREFNDQLRALPPFTSDPVDRLRHTVAAFESALGRDHVVTATAGAQDVIGHSWTGLTWQDLRDLLELLDQR